MVEKWEEPPLTHNDNEEFLRILRERKLKLGIEEAKVEVRFENVSVDAKVHVGRTALPTLFNVCINTLQEVIGAFGLGTTKRKSFKLLNRINGIIRPSRMTLVLGPPGSGKSTLLKALSGKLDAGLQLHGRITYNGQELSTTATGPCMSAYVSQYDLHHPEMTVRETIDFAGSLFRASNAIDILGETICRKKATVNKLEQETDAFVKATTCGKGRNPMTNYVLKLLGLSECADIMIGDEMRRGISGGEKKRLTIGEMLVSLARSFFMDDISTGLDSSTTFEVIMFLKQMTCLMDLTMVISLLQPPPETFELFDDIILLCEGKILYQGPRESISDFFEVLGFKCPQRKNLADFLQEVISEKDQAQYWTGNKGEYQYLSPERIAEAFCSVHPDLLLENELINPQNTTKNKTPTSNRRYISKWEAFKTCFTREWLLFKRNSPVHIFKLVQLTLLGIVIMTLFTRSEMEHTSIVDANKYFAAAMIGVIIITFNGMTELGMMVRRLPIFFKQRKMLNLPGWALLSSIFILGLPLSLVEAGLWTSLTYFVIGFASSVTRFFLQFLSLFCMHQVSMSLFRFLALVGKTQVKANVISSVALTAVYILGGYVISKDNIQPWMIWGYWASPMSYGQNAVALNEFLDERWSTEFHYDIIDADTVGKAILKARGLPTELRWFWISVGALVGFSVIFNILSVLAMEFLNPPKFQQISIDAISENVKQKKNMNGTTRNLEMVLPFQPLTLAFSHINYYVDMPVEMTKYGITANKLQLLKDVSGVFRPGILTALMGVTGAGKTTLLDVLAGRKTGGYIEGDVTISGYPKRQETFAKISGYCEQFDIHSPFVTVYESLQYSAWLRLPTNVDTSIRNMFIEEIMDLVELTPLKNAIVGFPGNGLSAEQRKRLTMAVELVSSPSIIFMDEPTSGLDARAAAIVMRAVRKTVDTGRTVVCTIHQPSVEIFESFDELLLMKRGGKLIYSGSLGPLSKRMVQYFETIPGVPRIKDGQNPAAWMLDVTSIAMEYTICVDYAEIYRNSSLYRENLQLVDELSRPQPNSEDLHFPPRYWQSYMSQLMACLWKQHRSYWKNSEFNLVRFVTTMAMALLFGVVFWKIGSNISSEQDVFNILGVMYGSALFQGFVNTSTLQPVIGMERLVVYRERSASMYSSMSYTIAQQISIDAISENVKQKKNMNGTTRNLEMVLPFQPLTLAFSHINYYVDMPVEMTKYGITANKLQLLKDVSGVFRPGILTALMGVTGAGKTTLLDVLAGRKTGGYIEGDVTISGYPKRQETFAKISGYCEQFDIHSPFVTVYESLQYSAWLRLPTNVDTCIRNMFIEEIMDLVELTPLKNAIVGFPGNGLSAEQRKRLTMAVELVSSPSIIFMDEPTSGLDARAAAIVMRAVRKTVDTGRTVVCTIHQPSVEIFESFDELLLMKRGGKLIYSGSLGPLSKKMVQYFETIPGVPRIKDGQNPAAWMLDITSIAMEYTICVDYAEIYRNSSLHRENLQLVDELSRPQPNSEDLHFPPRYWQSYRSQLMACWWKQHRSYWKNSEFNLVRFVTTIAIALLFGVVFWKIGSNISSEQDVFNILGVMYGSALFQGFVNTSTLQPVIGMERLVVYRERSAGMYSSMSYAIAQVSIEIPYVLVQAVIFSCVVYPMCGFQTSLVEFLWFFFFMMLSFTYFSLYGMATTALTPAPEIAALVSFFIYILWNVFSGFIISRKLIPVWWRWLYWADPTAWTVYGLMFSQLGDLDQVINVPGESDWTIKDFLMNYLGLQDNHFTLILILHAGVVVLLASLFAFGIKYLNFQKR